jgi:hypothetical protein
LQPVFIKLPRPLNVAIGQCNIRPALQRDVDQPEITRLEEVSCAFEQHGILIVRAR